MRFGSLLRLGLLALCWGSSFLWIKIALTGLSPIQITLVRLVLGAAVMLAFCLVTRLALPKDLKTWALIAVPAVAGAVIPFTLFGIGEGSIDSNVAGVLNATTPVLVALLAVVTGAERRPSWAQFAGIGVGFAGTMVILEPWRASGGTLAGALACVAAAALYAVSFIFIGRFLSRRVAPAALAASQLTVAAIIMIVITPFAGLTTVRLSWPVLVSVTVLGLAGTGLGFLLNYRLIADDGPTLASTVGYLMPAVSVLLGALILNEQLDAVTIGGMLLVLGGVALTRRRKIRTDSESATLATSTSPQSATGQPTGPAGLTNRAG
ncbi:DMT family transporter [Fodinicola feengrottensis]|uniref:DMT family transporter n=1 Tax=Fodinicola feengrottensis TaxID=435914 RepID=A0ABN2FP27_9ACTN